MMRGTVRRVARLFLCPIFVMAAALAAPAADEQADRHRAEVEAFIKKADEIIHDNDYDVKTTAHYKVKTDDPRFDVTAAAQLLESFRVYFDEFWKGHAELLPYDEPARVYLFYSRAKFRQLGVYQDRPDDLALIGHYQGFFDVVALHTDSVRPEEFPDLLIHEAAHQLVQRRLYGEGNTPRIWVTEGLANYFGNTLRDDSGKFHPGKIGGKEVVFIKGASRGESRLGWSQAKAYRRLLEKGEVLSLDTVLRTDDPGLFYDGRALERYSASWLLVHYLLHGDDNSHVAGLVAYMKHDAAGEGSAETLYHDLGMTADQLAAGFRAYVLQAKPR